MIHFAARLHAFVGRLFTPSDRAETRALYDNVAWLLDQRGLNGEAARKRLADRVADQVLSEFVSEPRHADREHFVGLVGRILDYEAMFRLPSIDWRERRDVSEYWALRDELNSQRALLDNFERTIDLITETLCRFLDPIVASCPSLLTSRGTDDGIAVSADLIRSIEDIDELTEHICAVLGDEELETIGLFVRHRRKVEANIVEASGGNPNNPRGFSKPLKFPTKSDIRDPERLVTTYLGGTPICDLFAGSIDFAIPTKSRFEHHHIVAGSGHGKTQTLQYLIAEDLEAVGRGERSVIVLR